MGHPAKDARRGAPSALQNEEATTGIVQTGDMVVTRSRGHAA